VRYQFLVDTYETEILKVVSVWAMFEDRDLPKRPHDSDKRGRSFQEHMVHQSVSEDFWFRTMLGIHVTDNPLPPKETRLDFIKCYVDNARRRHRIMSSKSEGWWEATVDFFEVKRSRAWIMTRRLTHTSHHRGQQMTLLRMLNRDLHSNYGPTADTGGLMQNHAPVIYAYPDLRTLIQEELADGRKSRLPGPGATPPTERPDR